MDLNEINKTIQSLIEKVDDKELLESLGSLNTSINEVIKEQEKVSHKIELLEEDNKFYKDAYKESIKYGGFVRTNEPKVDEIVESAQPTHMSIDEALAKFMSK